MLYFLVKRILLFFPTLIIISFLAFGLSKCTPGDPVQSYNNRIETEIKSEISAAAEERNYRQIAQLLGVDKPTFYFSFTSAAFPDTLYKYIRQDQRMALSKLIAQYGNWPQIQQYYQQLKQLDKALFSVPDTIAPDGFRQIRAAIKQLFIHYKDDRISHYLELIHKQLEENPALNNYLSNAFDNYFSSYTNIIESSTPGRLYWPTFYWYGFDNQYHRWISHFLIGDFGRSYTDNRPVFNRIMEALKWTLIINFFAILFAYGIALPIGVLSASKRDSVFDRGISLLLFMLYSLPYFWVATLLLVFFTTPEYGMKIFAASGLGNLLSDAPFWDRFWEKAAHLILPIICSSYTALAFISRQMRGGILNVIEEDFIRTAKAKGLSQDRIIWKHALRNSLFPIITLFATVFPAALAGSVIIEVVFNIPGMGRTVYDAILARDWPIVYTVLMLGAILTMTGILVADILYAKADPRVTFNQRQK